MDKFTMHTAASQSKLAYLKHLIESGLSVDSRDDQGRTPLHVAAQHNQYKVVNFLISNKCDLNLVDDIGRTPLLRAAAKWNKEVVHLLLDHGAEVTSADINKSTLLHFAAYNGWVDIVQRIVVSREADLDTATDCRWTPLPEALMSESTEIATLPIRAAADINARDEMKLTALHWATFTGNSTMVQVLLEIERLDINAQDRNGATPLHWACDIGHPEVVRQLLVAGADHKIKNNDGLTALSVGLRAANPSQQIIRLLIEHGTFFEDIDYVQIYGNLFLRETFLKDVDLCTKSIVNKYHSHSLPSMYCKPFFAKRLPSLEKFKLNARQIGEVENSVRIDIQTNTYCNLVKVCPMDLTVFCVKSLLSYQIYE